MRQTAVAVVGTVAALSVALAGCTASEPPIAVTHVHAVDFDDQRGSLYVATHDGILHIEVDGTGHEADEAGTAKVGAAERLGEWRGDVMAMARRDDSIYFSGHPSPGEDAPANIGAYQTDLRGSQFTPIALEGEVDFHSMSIGGAPLAPLGYAGVDSASGQVLVSRDQGETWTAGAAIVARSLSWDARADKLYATTEEGLQVSVDDGATFEPIAGAPSLLLIASSPTGTPSDPSLVGVDAEGVVHTSADGVTWTSAGDAPPGVQAISVGSRGSLIAAGVDDVQRSDDLGSTWTVIAEF